MRTLNVSGRGAELSLSQKFSPWISKGVFLSNLVSKQTTRSLGLPCVQPVFPRADKCYSCARIGVLLVGVDVGVDVGVLVGVDVGV